MDAFKESDMQIDEPITNNNHVEGPERLPEAAQDDSSSSSSQEMLVDAVDGGDRISDQEMYEAGGNGDGGGEDGHQTQQAPPPLAGELLKLSDPVLTCMVKVLMRKCNPPQEKFPMLGKNPRCPPWWPTGNEPWWGELGEGAAAQPPYKRAHHLSTADKAAVMVAMIKNIAPDFARLTLAMQMAKSVTSIMTAAEADIWDAAVVNERKRYVQAHAGASGPAPTRTVPVRANHRPAARRPVEKRSKKKEEPYAIMLTGEEEEDYVLTWPPSRSSNGGGATERKGGGEGVRAATRDDDERPDVIHGFVNHIESFLGIKWADVPDIPVTFPLVPDTEVDVIHDDRVIVTINGEDSDGTETQKEGYSTAFKEFERTPDGYKLLRHARKDARGNYHINYGALPANYNNREAAGNITFHGNKRFLLQIPLMKFVKSIQNQGPTSVFPPGAENPQKGNGDRAGGSCSYAMLQNAEACDDCEAGRSIPNIDDDMPQNAVMPGDHGFGDDIFNDEIILRTEPYRWHGDILMGGDDDSPSALDKWFQNKYVNANDFLRQPDSNRGDTR